MPNSHSSGSHRTSSSKSRRRSQMAYKSLEPRMLLAGDICFSPLSSTSWSPLSPEIVRTAGDQIHIEARELQLFDLEEQAVNALLSQAPLEFSDLAATKAITFAVPAPDGTFESFSIVESPILEPKLAEKFPGIKTYRGQGLNNPAATIRLGVTSKGFHAQILAPDNGDFYIDPYFHQETDVYASYFAHDALAQPGNTFQEFEIDHDHDHDDDDAIGRGGDGEIDPDDSGGPLGAPPFGAQLRTYQLAVAATGEYTQFHGGTVQAGMAAIVTTMNRVNGIYENDLGIRMVLVGNNDQLVYTNANTDPYTNSSGFSMLGENQSNIDNLIGNANYDIGHVFSTGGGGVAGLGVVGSTGNKARGVTGQPTPINDPFDVDYVAHEMGHQYGGNHTFNGDSGNCAGGNRNGSTAYEPGSGATIQAYAGICGNDNLQPNSDAMFHSLSIDEIRAYVTSGVGNSSATISGTGNSIPTVDAGDNYVIPAGTPFELTAVGSDPDGDSSLTYSWEQRDLGVQQDVNAGDNGSSPIFRTWDPTTSSTRSFPRLQDLLNNTTAVGETLPTTDRTMNFRVVARDNASGGGGVVSDDMTVNVNPTGNVFAITSQNGTETWAGQSQQTVTWNVAGTTTNGINTANVDIFLSTDGGQTFGTLLASGVANDGSHDITVPNVDATEARIKVKGAGNIFYDVNDADITITVAGPSVLVSQTGGSTTVAENGATDSYFLALATVPSGLVTLSATADSQTELSLDGTNYSASVSFGLTDTTPVEIFVQAIDDADEEGPHASTIAHEVISSNDPTDYPTSTVVADLAVTVVDDDLIEPLFIGVDFDDVAGSPPTNWTEINLGSNGTFNNLNAEDGAGTGFDLGINVGSGSWSDFAAIPNSSTIPQHGVSLTNIAGQIYTGGESIALTWSDLDPLLSYQIYVFSVDTFFDSIEQSVTVVGDSTTSFEQRFNAGSLFINDQIGSSTRNLQEYALVVGADSNGEIGITVDPIAGTSDVVLAGLAIVEIPNKAPTEILLAGDDIAENTDTSAGPVEIGLLTATDADSTSFTYSLVSGAGDTDNSSFEIVGDSLQIKQGTVIDYEALAAYSIRVEVSDGIDAYQQQLSVDVIDQAEITSLVIGDGTTQRSMLNSVVVSFDSIVTLGTTPFELVQRGPTGGLVDLTSLIDNSSGSSVVTLTFSGSFAEASGSLADGNYQLTVFGSDVQTLAGGAFDGDQNGTPGGDLVFGASSDDNFYRLFGDGTGDRIVNVFDLLALRQAYLSEDGDSEFNASFDSNNDGSINVFDLLRFRQNYLESLDFV